jgi:hypothetical protein
MGWGSRIFERRVQRRTHALNQAIRSLPLSTREAMLAAADAEELIAGAYSDGRGGACPMLAAHRRGARNHARGFPCAWDSFTQARRARHATPRELEILKALLQESIDGERPQPAAEPTAPIPVDGVPS